MSKLLISSAVGSSLVALGLLGVVRSVATASPTTSEPVALVAVQSSRVDLPAAPPPQPNDRAPVVVLDELHVVGQRTRRPPPAPVQARARPLVPCSAWRAIGPVYAVRDGEAPRERHVQMLCPKGEAVR